MPNGLFLTLIVVILVASIPLGIALSVLLDDGGANEYDPSIWRDSGGYIGWALMRIAPVRAIVCILCVGMAFIMLAMFLSFLWGRFLSWLGSGTPVDTEVWIEGSTIRVIHKDPASYAQGSPLVLQLGYIDSVSYVDSHKNGWIEIKYRSSDGRRGGTELWGLDPVDDDTRRQLLTCMDRYSRKYLRKSIYFG